MIDLMRVSDFELRRLLQSALSLQLEAAVAMLEGRPVVDQLVDGVFPLEVLVEARRRGWDRPVGAGLPSPDSQPMPAVEGSSQGPQARPPQGVDGDPTVGHV